MSKKLIALDLDGTLLNSHNEITPYTASVLKKLEEQGHLVVITTGRPYFMSLQYYKALGLKTPMINYNGALTHLPNKKWEFEHVRLIDKKFLFQSLDLEKEFEMDFIASQYRHKFFVSYNNPEKINPNFFGEETFTDDMIMRRELITEDPNSLLLQTRAKNKYDLADHIKDTFHNELEVSTWGGPLNILEFAPKGVNKAYALEHLVKVLNLSKDDIIAFGDEHNDQEMLAFAGVGYAMKNASEILLPHADRVTEKDNNHDGVAHELSKLLL